MVEQEKKLKWFNRYVNSEDFRFEFAKFYASETIKTCNIDPIKIPVADTYYDRIIENLSKQRRIR